MFSIKTICISQIEMHKLVSLKALSFVIITLGVIAMNIWENALIRKEQSKNLCKPMVNREYAYARSGMIFEGRFDTNFATDVDRINGDADKPTKDSHQGKVQRSEPAKYIKQVAKLTRSIGFMEGLNSSLQRGKMKHVYIKKHAVRRAARRRRAASRRRRCWKSDPVSWTATQLRPNCKVPKAFRRWDSIVKRIIYNNKTVEYTVCSKGTKKCKEQPYYSWRLKTMIERPPCCIAHILETFSHVTTILDMAKIPYFLTAGGLIGWVKRKSIPRYENDLDILVDFLYWSRFKENMMAKVVKYGHFANEKFPRFLRIYYSKTNKVFVDAWPYKIIKRNGSRWVKTVSMLTWHDNPYSSIFPLKRSTYSGIPVWVPNNPEDVLDRHYGKRFNWRKNVTCKTNFKQKCTS